MLLQIELVAKVSIFTIGIMQIQYANRILQMQTPLDVNGTICVVLFQNECICFTPIQHLFYISFT